MAHSPTSVTAINQLNIPQLFPDFDNNSETSNNNTETPCYQCNARGELWRVHMSPTISHLQCARHRREFMSYLSSTIEPVTVLKSKMELDASREEEVDDVLDDFESEDGIVGEDDGEDDGDDDDEDVLAQVQRMTEDDQKPHPQK